jgi:hypothetical protein
MLAIISGGMGTLGVGMRILEELSLGPLLLSIGVPTACQYKTLLSSWNFLDSRDLSADLIAVTYLESARTTHAITAGGMAHPGEAGKIEAAP